MKQFRKFISGALTLSTALTLSGAGMVSRAFAGALTETQITMTDSRSGNTSDHTFAFKVASTTAIQGFTFVYSRAASGAVNTPDSLDTTTVNITPTVTVEGVANAGWAAASAANGTVTVTKAAGSGALTAGDDITVTLANITNNNGAVSGGNQCDAIANSDTCFVRITSYDDDLTLDGTTDIDNSVGSYTIISAVTVTATVDPSLAFTVAGVTTLANLNSFDTEADCTGDDVVATATAIPFGNIRVAVHKCAQQSLTLATNANYGASVYHKFIGANIMVGTVGTNNFDPFNNASWSDPDPWAAPAGSTPNVNTAFVGMRTTNANIPNFNAAENYAGPAYNTAGLGNKVMDSTTPVNTTSYVTYRVQTNALQPSDVYTGTMMYNVVAKY